MINQSGRSGELEAWISIAGDIIGVSAGQSRAYVCGGEGVILCVMVAERDALGD